MTQRLTRYAYAIVLGIMWAMLVHTAHGYATVLLGAVVIGFVLATVFE